MLPSESTLKILITGGTGFLGSHLLRNCIANDHSVVLVSRDSSSYSRIADCLAKVELCGNSAVELESVFSQSEKIDVVLHCATSYGRNHDLLADICASNIQFPLKLLELSRRHRVRAFINTDSFFNIDISFDEFASQKRYLQEYSLSKRQFLEWGKLISKSDGSMFINMKLEHIYGESDKISKFVPQIINKCLSNVKSIDLTCAEHYRDFIYVEDVVAAYTIIINLINCFGLASGYHQFGVGKGQATRVRDFVEMVKSVTKSETLLNFGAINNRDVECPYSAANISGLTAHGWAPKYDDESGVRRYIDQEFERS